LIVVEIMLACSKCNDRDTCAASGPKDTYWPMRSFK
jgi:hypothetical protein